MKDFLTAVKDRRSIYGIGKQAVVPDNRIRELIAHALNYAPSAMNAQSARVVLLLGRHHDRLWDIVAETLKKLVPPEKFAPTQKKLDAFKAGYATILYFEDMEVVEGLQKKYPTYAQNFPNWSQQASGMLQFILWTALEAEGAGVSLQHYNPVIDDAVRQEWSLPQSWKLIAQMPIGNVTAPPDEKVMQPVEARSKVFK